MSDPAAPFKRVIIDWLDAFSEDGWADFDDKDVRSEHPVTTIGWVIREDDNYIVVAGSISPDPRKSGNWQVSGAMGIPKGCITGRRELP